MSERGFVIGGWVRAGLIGGGSNGVFRVFGGNRGNGGNRGIFLILVPALSASATGPPSLWWGLPWGSGERGFWV